MRYIKKFEYFGEGEYADFDNDAGEMFWGNVAGGCLPICVSTKRILLNYRSKYVNEPHTWSVSGGKIDEGENIEYGVRRELFEETGYNKNIEMIPIFVFRTENKTFEYHNFIGVVENEFKPILNWEFEKFKWLTYDEFVTIEPKHPGLKLLLNDKYSLNAIKKIINQ